jgi:hypothetical protein
MSDVTREFVAWYVERKEAGSLRESAAPTEGTGGSPRSEADQKDTPSPPPPPSRPPPEPRSRRGPAVTQAEGHLTLKRYPRDREDRHHRGTMRRLTLVVGVSVLLVLGFGAAYVLAGGLNGNTPVTICHKPGTDDEQTITVDDDAVKEHLDHGDISVHAGR